MKHRHYHIHNISPPFTMQNIAPPPNRPMLLAPRALQALPFLIFTLLIALLFIFALLPLANNAKAQPLVSTMTSAIPAVIATSKDHRKAPPAPTKPTDKSVKIALE